MLSGAFNLSDAIRYKNSDLPVSIHQSLRHFQSFNSFVACYVSVGTAGLLSSFLTFFFFGPDRSQAIRKMAKKRLEAEKLTDLETTKYTVWHEEYNQYVKCTAYFIQGVTELYRNEK